MRSTRYLFVLLAALAMPAYFAGCGSTAPPANDSTSHEAHDDHDHDHDHADHEGHDHEGHDHEDHDHDGDGQPDHDAQDH